MLDFSKRKHGDVLVLFDIDGTLTLPRKTAPKEIYTMLDALRKEYVIGTVGGSDFPKQKEQIGDDVLDRFDFAFPQNGLDAYNSEEKLATQNFAKFMGEDKIKALVNYCMVMLSKIDLPIKRGTFIEFRSGMINLSPIGRNCSQEEREAYAEYDAKHQIREKIVKELSEQFKDFKLQFSIGGQISIDIFPEGWNKTYCLRHVEEYKFKEIHFFGDKTHKGGNDYEIFHDDNTVGHTVTSPQDTIAQVTKLFLS